MTAVADKLREARALIAKGWCQGALARGVSGRPVKGDSEKAVSFCASGAIFRVDDSPWSGSFPFLRRAVGDGIIPHWNDQPKRTQAEVLAAFDKAIELAESGQ